MVVNDTPAFFEFAKDECEFAARHVVRTLKRPTAEHYRGVFRKYCYLQIGKRESAHFLARIVTLFISVERLLPTAGDICRDESEFLAFPVVDEKQRMVGVVDVGVFTDEVFDVAQRTQWDEVFEAIGFRVSQVRDASPLRAFRFRFPWLMATIASGTLCALLASAYEMTLAKSLVLAFFLTLVLGLGESVSIQSMTITIQALRSAQPTIRWYVRTLRREASTAILLGTGCGTIVGLIVWLWRGAGMAAVSIGTSILLTLVASCVFGLSIPALLHALKLDPKIAAGPMTLALADIFTLLFYFSLAALLL